MRRPQRFKGRLGGRLGPWGLGLCCSLPEIDSWHPRAEVSPLNKMKSVSQRTETTGRFGKALAKSTSGQGMGRSRLRRGSLCISPAGSCQRLGGQAAGSAIQLALRGGALDRQMRTRGERRLEGERSPPREQPGCGSLGGVQPCPSLACCHPGPQFPRVKGEGASLGACRSDDLGVSGAERSRPHLLLRRLGSLV